VVRATHPPRRSATANVGFAVTVDIGKSQRAIIYNLVPTPGIREVV